MRDPDSRDRSRHRPATAARWLALTAWGYLAWLLLTLTATTESLLVGVVVAAAVAAALLPLGDVVAPWTLLDPRRVRDEVVLVALLAGKVVVANVGLARRVWSRRLPAGTGMVVIGTAARSDGVTAGVGLLTSLVVDNQLVDLDRKRHELLYHCIEVPPPDRRRATITGRVEGLLVRLGRDG